MPAKKADWEQVEREYVAGDATYAELAEKYGVSARTVETHDSDGNWGDKRNAHREEVAG